MHFKWVPTTYSFIIDKTSTGCNLKLMELLDCALVEVWAVIRLDTVTYEIADEIPYNF